MAALKTFVFYWLTNNRNIRRAESPEAAFSALGFGGGALAALDFYTTKGDTHYWDPDKRRWEEKASHVQILPPPDGVNVEEYLTEQFDQLIERAVTVIYDLPNKDQVCFSLNMGDYLKHRNLLHYQVSYGEYVDGPYHPDGDETCHYMGTDSVDYHYRRKTEAVAAAVRFACDIPVGKELPCLRGDTIDEIAEMM